MTALSGYTITSVPSHHTKALCPPIHFHSPTPPSALTISFLFVSLFITELYGDGDDSNTVVMGLDFMTALR